MQIFLSDRIPTPIGELLLIADQQGQVRGLDWSDHEQRLMKLLDARYRQHPFLLQTADNPAGLSEMIQRYFAGELAVLSQIPVVSHGTPFQCSVWQQLRLIPAGSTISYGELAKRVDRPRAVRAVGAANGANPISIIVPCHRVIGANGMMTGYAGGLPRKQWLLKHEGFLR
ncbi:methylated-DNA--[protein]-cysteine S-methyltransferase [Serratia microhaemolytica]|uniref:methylated-DNA--[protein]-cysteine S-methyltransferase n=1 Tax=Serratia microhaemolytica TaxID=2675110 RepID=UPI000FDE5582|nr:methylated-DNA--[protein]-cysteine S-methyltransferase [Serratia microhaemolytica]